MSTTHGLNVEGAVVCGASPRVDGANTSSQRDLVSCPECRSSMSTEKVTWVPVSADDATSSIGGGIHTGLRKGTDAPEAHDLWVAIRDSPRAWSEALEFFVWGLDQMGMALCKKESD